MLYAEVSIASKHLECQMFQRMSSQIFASLEPPLNCYIFSSSFRLPIFRTNSSGLP